MAEGYRYDERNELTERVRTGSLTAYHYDKNSSIISEEEEGRQSEYRYDLLNRQTYVRALDGREQENSYDGENLRAGLIENGRKTTFLYYNGEILAECDGLNLYAYCANNPVMYYDPSGHGTTENRCGAEGVKKPKDTPAG